MAKEKQAKPNATAPEELSDAELEDAQGGIIAVLIGVQSSDPKIGTSVKSPSIRDGTSNILAGDGSV